MPNFIRAFIDAILSLFWPIHDYVKEVVLSTQVLPHAWKFHRPTPSMVQVELSQFAYPGLFGAIVVLGLGGVVELWASSIDSEPLKLNWRERNLLREAVLDLADFNDMAILDEAEELTRSAQTAG